MSARCRVAGDGKGLGAARAHRHHTQCPTRRCDRESSPVNEPEGRTARQRSSFHRTDSPCSPSGSRRRRVVFERRDFRGETARSAVSSVPDPAPRAMSCSRCMSVTAAGEGGFGELDVAAQAPDRVAETSKCARWCAPLAAPGRGDGVVGWSAHAHTGRGLTRRLCVRHCARVT